LADHRTFNDPFDLKAEVIFGGTREQKEARLKSLIANQSPHSPRKERREMLGKFMAKPSEEFAANVREAFRQRAVEVGVCSFGAYPDICVRGHIIVSKGEMNDRRHQSCQDTAA
jgi:hypothetical protein